MTTPAPTDAEGRLRDGAPLDAADRAALLAALAELRALADERWAAITRLAPAAKELRLRSQALARGLDALAAILDPQGDQAGGDPAAMVDAARAELARRRPPPRDNAG